MVNKIGKAGILNRLFGRRAEPETEEDLDLLNGFVEVGAPFMFNNVRKVVTKEQDLKAIRVASSEFRDALAKDDVNGAAKALMSFVSTHGGKTDDPRPPKMMRALFQRMEDPTEHSELIFMYMEKYSCNNPLGRNLCRMIVENGLLEGFEEHVRKHNSPTDIAERASFYGELEKNFIKHILS